MKDNLNRLDDKKNIFEIYSKYLKIFKKYLKNINDFKGEDFTNAELGKLKLKLEQSIDKFIDDLIEYGESDELLKLSLKVTRSDIINPLKVSLLHGISLAMYEVHQKKLKDVMDLNEIKNTLEKIL